MNFLWNSYLSTEDDERSERTDEIVTAKSNKTIHKMILDDFKIKLTGILENLKIPKEPVGHLVNKYLGIRKLCAKRSMRDLTIGRLIVSQIDENDVKTNSNCSSFLLSLHMYPLSCFCCTQTSRKYSLYRFLAPMKS